jgi:osmotically-inducible protein OsmY
MRIRIATWLLAGSLAWLPAQTEPPRDAVLRDQVSLALALDPDVRGNAIVVEVKDGAVTLHGRVPNKKAREKATRLAKKIKGVKSVDNQLKLTSEP